MAMNASECRGIVQHQALCTAHACIHLPPKRRKAGSLTKGGTELRRRDFGDAGKGLVCQALIEVFDDIGQYAGRGRLPVSRRSEGGEGLLTTATSAASKARLNPTA